MNIYYAHINCKPLFNDYCRKSSKHNCLLLRKMLNYQTFNFAIINKAINPVFAGLFTNRVLRRKIISSINRLFIVIQCNHWLQYCVPWLICWYRSVNIVGRWKFNLYLDFTVQKWNVYCRFQNLSHSVLLRKMLNYQTLSFSTYNKYFLFKKYVLKLWNETNMN